MSKKRAQKKENTISFNNMVQEKRRGPELIPKSLNQETYIVGLLDDKTDIVIAYGPAGCGKTYLAMQAAIKAFKQGQCERIVLTRPAVGVDDEQHGFLPGTLEEKMAPWTRPLFDVLREYYSAPEITNMLEEQVVEVAPLAYMRGRTFKNAWIIGDEMQNATPSQMKMLLTRIGEGSKIVVTGDVEQADRRAKQNGLLDLCTRLQTQTEGITVCKLSSKDIQRHRIIDTVLDIYDEED
jgi:phosphate starvation-inducible PhoH-like protein